MSYYATYRPQTFADLDLAGARASLSQILTSGKFSHAYLFSGPKGTGKTSSARILAKVLNCEQNNSLPQEAGSPLKRESHSTLLEPCNQCDNCKRITLGTSMACYEMDAASNRGIDDIRSLRDQVGLTPAEGRYIVYIIDEVHMLTTEAFNALLKTLEEPPAHAVFVLCTTHPQKIPDTVISRCTRVQFQKATDQEIAQSLAKAVKGEKLQVDEGVLTTIARRMDGSFRDAMKTLEQLAQQNTHITVEMVHEATGYGEAYEVEKLIQALLDRDAPLALKTIAQKQTAGVDVGILSKHLVERLREMLLASITSQPLLDLTQRMSVAAMEVKQAVIPVLPLEIAVVEWCLTVVNDGSPKFPPKVDQPMADKVQMPNQQEEKKMVVEEKEPVRKKVRGAFEGTLAEIQAKWRDILVLVRPENHSLEALLRSARPSLYQEGWLLIEAFYKFHKEQLEQERNRKKLEEIISEVMGGTIYLKFQLMKGKMIEDTKIENVTGRVTDDALVRAAEEILG